MRRPQPAPSLQEAEGIQEDAPANIASDEIAPDVAWTGDEEPSDARVQRGLVDRTADDRADDNSADRTAGDGATAGTASGQAGADSEHVGGGGASVDAGDVARRRFLSIARRRAAHFAHFDDSSRLSSAPRAGVREPPPAARASAPSASAQAGAAERAAGSDAPAPALAGGEGGPGGGNSAGGGGRGGRREGGAGRGEAGEAEHWPGPFATARQLVRGRAAAAAARQAQGGAGARTGGSAAGEVEKSEGRAGAGAGASAVVAGGVVAWTPKARVPDLALTDSKQQGGVKDWRIGTGGSGGGGGGGGGGRGPRSLYSLCLELVATHIDGLESVEGVPDAVRRDLSACLSAQRRLDGRVLHLLLEGVATELSVADCSLVSEADLKSALSTCNAANLELFHLSMCGRSLSDACLTTTLLHSPTTLPALRSLALQGAYRLSDASLPPLALAAPALAHLSLLHCPLLSSPAVSTLISSLSSSLNTLRLDGCCQLDAAVLLLGMKQLTGLSCLSLAGLSSVSDAVLSELLPAIGSNLKELSLAHCEEITDASVAAAAANAPSLTALDLSHLPLLTDASLHSLCSAQLKLRSLNLTRASFSDAALAALIQASGAALQILSVNAVYEAGDGLLISLARCSHESLESLDVSWCRSVSNHALGLLADSCPNLSRLCLYGCSQVTDVFYLGHSNPRLHLIGQVGMVIN
ncbi:hypothetical protein CLOP_g24746 [Closterium sp. NIES-67]|nr:hypothetical protein CLOP_g24746 [Closterium sp. NIES-67]